MSEKTNVDLVREREHAEIKCNEFAKWWAGGRDKLEQRRALEKLFFDDREFEDNQHIAYKSHKELFEYTTAKATKFLLKLRDYSAQQEQRVPAGDAKPKSEIQKMRDFRMLLSGPLGTALFQQSFPLRLHYAMFLPALLGHGTDEQQTHWLEKAWNMKGIIGTYAQTELGHGTYLRGLETRADYDVESEEFILNTPTLTAYKWWPGGLGQAANMVVVMAQLYIKGKHYGLHPFLVRIRSEETHFPEPGVDVGEIGVKIGLNGVNNGFLGFKNVRIPRTQMLMKHAQVMPNGKFVKGPEPLLTYGTMVYVRVIIVCDVSFCLLQAATIATRYSAVRHQSVIEPNQPEVQIIDHITQQQKIFPQIAKGVFFKLTADFVWSIYENVMNELEQGNRRNLPELHALTCCLKAVCSQEAASGVEILRKSCGGHGFLSSANFSQIYAFATAACTYEGENTVLLLQTGRFFMKTFLEGLKRKVLPKTVAYLRESDQLKWIDDDLPLTLVHIFEIAATAKVRSAFFYHKNLKTQKKYSEEKAASLTGLKLIQAATMHGRVILARIAYDEYQRISKNVSNTISKVLSQLLLIFLLDMFFESLGAILQNVRISTPKIQKFEEIYEQTLLAFRRNAVALVDGFDFHDRVLGSTLGSYDGRVYERLMEAARQSPLNQVAVPATFHTSLKPLMRGKL